MSKGTSTDTLVRFFKVLGEPNRLKIVGHLAGGAHTVEQIARFLGVGVSTASHHLSRLAEEGLVSARAEGYYSVYSLHTEVLTEMAKTLLRRETLPRLAGEVEGDAYYRKVLATFANPDGSFRAFPAQEKKYMVLVRHVLKEFEPGTKYPEKRVNQILRKYSEDTARLRRSLVDTGLMKREGGGGKYWRV